MRYLLPVLFVLSISHPGLAQDITDKTFDCTHKKSMCTVDTTVTIHSERDLVISDSVNLDYEFKSGKRAYIEIRLRSTICSCKDCSFADHLSIDITDLKPGDQVSISPQNTIWMHWNSMMMGHLENYFAGTFTYNGAGDFVLEVYKFLPAQPEVRYDGIRLVGS